MSSSRTGRLKFVEHTTRPNPNVKGERIVEATIVDNGEEITIQGLGTGPIDGFVDALRRHLGLDFSVFDYSEHSLGAGSDARAICYMEIQHPGGRLFGAGINKNIVTASLEAIVSAAQPAARPVTAAGEGASGTAEATPSSCGGAAGDPNRLHAIELGAGEGPPVVLLHGFDGRAEVWGPIQAGLAADGRRTIAFDLPGHGRSRDFPGFGPPKVAARAVIAELDRRDIASAHLVGHSMGGGCRRARLPVRAGPRRLADAAGARRIRRGDRLRADPLGHGSRRRRLAPRRPRRHGRAGLAAARGTGGGHPRRPPSR